MSAAQIEEFAEQMAGYMQYALEHEKAAAESTLLEIIYRICVLCAVVKNVKFKAENEHRLLYAALLTYGAGGTRVIGDLKERKWRNGAHGITPYFEKTNVKHAIRQIVMGPNCVELTGAHINDFLISNGLPDNLLCRSEATLR